MAVQRMDNVAIVDDLSAAIAFFVELGLEVEDEAAIEGHWADLVVGLDDIRSHIVMMRTPDGHSRIELTKYHRPRAIDMGSPVAVNTVGLTPHHVRRRWTRRRRHPAASKWRRAHRRGFELHGHLLCYLRGPENIVIGLAEQLG